MPSRPANHSDHCPMSFQGPVAQRSRPRLPHPSPRVTRGHHLPLQVQLAETEAFSLNSDRSSSILLGDDLSLEDPTACPQGPKESKVGGQEFLTFFSTCDASLSGQVGLRWVQSR